MESSGGNGDAEGVLDKVIVREVAETRHEVGGQEPECSNRERDAEGSRAAEGNDYAPEAEEGANSGQPGTIVHRLCVRLDRKKDGGSDPEHAGAQVSDPSDPSNGLLGCSVELSEGRREREALGGKQKGKNGSEKRCNQKEGRPGLPSQV